MNDDGKSDIGKRVDNPDWIEEINRAECLRIDVRPILARGEDPRDQILDRVEHLKPDTILLVETPFDPVPLRRLLAGRGFDSHAVQLSDSHWQVYFRPGPCPAFPAFPDLPVFPMTWIEGILEMDLRELEPPNPMIAILKVIESGEGGDAFTVRLIRDPIYLYPELVERQWRAQILHQDENELKVRIFKIDEKGKT